MADQFRIDEGLTAETLEVGVMRFTGLLIMEFHADVSLLLISLPYGV
jgi:hypothetical protein